MGTATTLGSRAGFFQNFNGDLENWSIEVNLQKATHATRSLWDMRCPLRDGPGWFILPSLLVGVIDLCIGLLLAMFRGYLVGIDL